MPRKTNKEMLEKIKKLLSYPKAMIQIMLELEIQLKKEKKVKRLHAVIIDQLEDSRWKLERVRKMLNTLIRREERKG